MATRQHGYYSVCFVFFSFVQSHIRDGYPAFFDKTNESSNSTPARYNFGWTTMVARLASAGIFAKPAEPGTIIEHTYAACLLEFMKYGQIYAAGNL